MQDYRNEVKEFFSGDEQLAAELEFALQMAEKEREMEAQMNICSLAGDAKTPNTLVRTQNLHTTEESTSISLLLIVYAGIEFFKTS